MAVGPDGNVWFTEGKASKVAELLPKEPSPVRDADREQWSGGDVVRRGR